MVLINTDNNEKVNTPKKIKINRENVIMSLFMILITLNILINLLLVNDYYSFKSLEYSSSSFCESLTNSSDCGNIFLSEYSSLFGVPISIFSLIYYLVQFFLIVNFFSIREDLDKKYMISSFLLALIAFGIHSYLIITMIFTIKAICLFCLILYIINALIMLLFLLIKPKLYQIIEYLKTLGNYLFGMFKSIKPINKKYNNNLIDLINILELTIVSLITLFTYIYFYQKYPSYKVTPQEINERYLTADTTNIRIDNLSLKCKRGSDLAKLKIYYFYDYDCPFCKKTSKSLDYVYDYYPNDLQVYYIPFPLNNACNPLTKMQKKHSCDLANISFVSAKKDKFFETYKSILMSDSYETYLASETMGNQFDIYGSQKMLEEQISYTSTYEYKIAKSLHIDAVPFILINQKKIVGNVNPQLLLQIIQMELKANTKN